MKVILFAGAEIKQYDFCKKYIENADVILCCDSGIRHTRVLGIVPDYILGDFDFSHNPSPQTVNAFAPIIGIL